MIKAAGLLCLLMALGLVAAAKGRYTIQPVEERGPAARTAAYVVAGTGFALVAALLFGTDG